MVRGVAKRDLDEGWVTPESAKDKDCSPSTNTKDIEDEKNNSVYYCWFILVFSLSLLVVLCILLGYVFMSSGHSLTYTSINGDGWSSHSGESKEFNLFDLFGMGPKMQEYPVSVSLEEINLGVKRDFSITLSQRCSHCHGEGIHTHSCPLCGGRGVINTHRGMTYCSRCRGQGIIAGSTCETCNGSGSTTHQHNIDLIIPAGVMDGWSRVYELPNNSKIRIRIKQKTHNIFTRRDNDIVMHVQLSLKEALLGTELHIPTLTPLTHTLTIPAASVQHLEEIRVKGKGLPIIEKTMSSLFGSSHGDLVIVTEIQFPSHLTKEQRQMVTDFF